MTIDRRAVMSCALSAGVALASALVVRRASANDYDVGKIRIEHPWLRAPLEGETRAQLFMAILNKSDRPDRLIRVKSPDLKSAEFHVAPHFIVREDAIYLPPLSRVILAPGASYVQLLDIAKIDPVGGGLPLTLVFESAGEVKIDASIDAPDATHAHDAEALERWRKAREAREKPSPESEAPSDKSHQDDMKIDRGPSEDGGGASPPGQSE